MLTLGAAGEPITLITVNDQLRRSGRLEAVGGPLALLEEHAAIEASLDRYVAMAREAAVLHELIQSSPRSRRRTTCSCRAEAKKRFTVADRALATVGIECREDEDVIHEARGAYTPIDAVVEARKDLVEIVYTLRQVVCVKG